MATGPSKIAERIVALLVPPACGEEVLGDLYERFRSPGQYFLDALRTVPLVILSRVRRTADPKIALLQAGFLYLSFLGAAWFKDRALLQEQFQLFRLAIPAGAALTGLILADAYATPGLESSWRFLRGPALGIAFSFLSQAVFWTLALPASVMLYGCAMSLVTSSAVRVLFPPGAIRAQGVNVPTAMLEMEGPSQTFAQIAKIVAGLAAVAIIGAWILDRAPHTGPRIGVPGLIIVLVAYALSRRNGV